MSDDERTTTNEVPEADGSSQRVADLISALLRWGVRGSLVLIVVGTLISFAFGAASRQTVKQLTGESAAFPRSVSWLVDSLASGQGRAVIVLGLLLLIATPVLRVLVSLTVFARQGDRIYVLITATVLLLLALSFILGKAAQ
jgi:uncharacterized membrane protein